VGNNLILDRSYQFALNVIALSRLLCERREFVLSRQLLRAGTSVGANVEEALAAQSSKDFRSKLAIARKEARESRYWLRLLRDSSLVPPSESRPLIQEAEAIIRILTAIILTSSQNNQQP
jgi:four helix bundle protein